MKYLAFLALVALLGVGVQGQAADEVVALKARYVEALKAYQVEYRQARKKGLPRSEWPEHPAKRFFAEFKAIAFSEPESSDATGEALVWMLQNVGHVNRSYAATTKKRQQIAARLLAHHVTKPCMEAVAQVYFRPSKADRPKFIEALDKILAKNRHPRVRAQALYSKANCLAGKYMGPTKEELEEARTLIKTLLAEHGDTPVAKRAEPFAFELNHLQIGQVAPDFETTDVDGVKFKLSDYRGKVVVLDFWGFW